MSVKVKIIRQMTLHIGEDATYKTGEFATIPQALFDRHPGWFELATIILKPRKSAARKSDA